MLGLSTPRSQLRHCAARVLGQFTDSYRLSLFNAFPKNGALLSSKLCGVILGKIPSSYQRHDAAQNEQQADCSPSFFHLFLSLVGSRRAGTKLSKQLGLGDFQC
jgi:hypothetical protein